VTRDLGFFGLIRRTPHSVAFYDTHGDAEDLFQPGYCYEVNKYIETLTENVVEEIVFRKDIGILETQQAKKVVNPNKQSEKAHKNRVP
jgi:hypothetical protein